jgi:hypothetical protein
MMAKGEAQRKPADERQRLSRFVVVVTEFMLRDRPESRGLLAHLEGIERAPLGGIRMAASDMVEWCCDLKGDQLVRLDSKLSSAGLPTLSAMRNAAYRKVVAVLGRGRVRTESEWHLLNSFVGDIADRKLSAEESAQAARLLSEYRAET